MVSRILASSVLNLALLAAGFAVPGMASAAEVSFSPFRGMRMSTTVDSMQEQRWKRVIRQSYDISCGSAALATILRYQYGHQISEQELIKALLERVQEKEVSRRGGFTLLDLKYVATNLGYTVHGYQLSLDQLAGLGVPALVPISLRGYKHFVIFRGIVGDRVVLADPAFGNLMVPDFLFEDAWQRIALVVERDGLAPPPAQLSVSDPYMAETPEALSAFLRRVDVNNAVGVNEF